MSEVFDIYWQRKDKLSLGRVTENMCVKKVTLEEYIKLYNIAWFNEDDKGRSSERGCYIATKKFVTNYINALISNSFNLFQEIAKVYIGEIDHSKLYRLEIDEADYMQIHSRWYWHIKNDKVIPDEKEHTELLEEVQEIYKWIKQLKYYDFVLIYRLRKRKESFKFQCVEYFPQLGKNYYYMEYKEIKDKIFRAYDRKKRDIKSELNYIKQKIKWCESINQTAGSPLYYDYIKDQIEQENQLKYLDSDLRDFKMFDDSLNIQMAKERKKEGLE